MKNDYGHRLLMAWGQFLGSIFETHFESLSSGSFTWVKTAALAVSVSIAVSGCGASGSQHNGTVGGAPTGAAYSRNPASYPYGSAITTNVLSYSGVADAITISPALPAGLTFNTSSGSISGTPSTITAQQNYQVKVANGYGSTYVQLSLAITDQPPTISYGGSKTLNYTVGTAITTITPTLGGGTTTSCSSSPALPAGLSLSPACVISGTPSAPVAAKNYVISAVNGGGSASLTFSITVVDVAPSLSYSPATYTLYVGQAISAIAPLSSGGVVVSCLATPGLPAGLAISSSCVITGTPTTTSAATNYTITGTNTGGTSSPIINLTIVPAAPSIVYTPNSATLTVGTAITTMNVVNTGGTIASCSVSPALPAGLSLNTTSCAITGTPTAITAAAPYAVTATNVTGSSSTNVTLTVNDRVPVISYVGSPYTYLKNQAITSLTPTNTGGAIVSCSATPTLPTGLSLSAGCVLSGTPSALSAAANYVIHAVNTGGTATATINITVNDIAPNLTYAGSPFVFTKGSAITTVTPTNTGNAPVSCTSTPSLPAGLSLSSTCDITGAPTVVAPSTTYSIVGTNTAGSSTVLINVTVNDILPVISYAGGPFVYVDNTAITTLTPTNTGGAIVSCSSSPTLPAGLSLSNTCVLSGTPSVSSSATNYTVTAQNSAGTASALINIQINEVLPVISFANTPFSFSKGIAITSQTPTNTGGTVTSCASVPTLPAGLALSSSCVLSGTPTVISTAATYTITGTNAMGSNTTSISITVNDVAPAINYLPSSYNFTYVKGSAITALTPNNTGGTITGCSSAPTLPAGLSISGTDCSITGTPSVVVASTAYTISASNSGGTSTAVITISINDLAPIISYTGSPFSYTINTAITTLTPTSSGGTIVSCSSTPPLPAGLSIAATTCAVSGTPTTITANASYTISATNSGGSSSQIIQIAVIDTPPTLSFTGLGSPFTYTNGVAISAVTPTISGGTITSCTSSPALPTGLTLSQSTCVLSGTPTTINAATDYTITATNSGGSATSAINITVNDVAPSLTYSSGTYSFSRSVAAATVTPTNTGGGIVSCASSPALPAGLSLSSTGCAISGTPTTLSAASSYTITATNTGGTSSVSLTLSVIDLLPVITYATSTEVMTLGSAMTTLNASSTGGPILSCTIAPALPAGLSISNTTCAISGTPTALSPVTTYIVSATNGTGSGSASVTLTVNAVAPSITYSGSPFVYVKGTAISTLTPTNTGGTLTSCSASPSLPAGLSLSATCVLSGTPTAVAGSTVYTITGTNSGGSSSTTLGITVNDVLPVISFGGSPFTWSTGSAITAQTPTNTGGTITSCASTPTLPAGISLSATCVLTGTPTAAQGASSYTINATNSAGTAAASISITINNSAPVIAYLGAPYTWTNGTLITTQTPTSSGGAITSCTASPTLPTGLSLAASTCAISGTPTVVSAATSYTITATNAAGSGTATISITVNAVAPNLIFAGSPYTFTNGTAITAVTPTNSGGTVVSCASSPTLPSGLTLSATCGITGTPTVVSVASSYTITGTNSGGTSVKSINITVNDTLPVISYAGSPYSWTRTTAISAQTPTNTGGTITSCSSTPTLPAGIALSATCVMTGTPTVAQSATTYTINATNSAGTATATISITVVNNLPVIAYSGSPYSWTKGTAITTQTPTSTGGAITSCSASPALPTGLTIAATTCAISGTPSVVSATTSYTITATNAAGTGTATISITVTDVIAALAYAGSPFTYTKGTAITAVTPTNTGGTVISCTSAPALPAGLTLSATCGITGTPTAVTATNTYSISATNSGGIDTVTISITVNDTLPVISYAGSPYSWTRTTAIATQTPTNTGGTVTSCTSTPTLPAGIALSATCVMTGTPTVAQSATSYTINATNSAGTATATITITVVNNLPVIAYAGSPYTWVKGTAITTQTPASTGGAITSCAAAPALPTGLAIAATTCAISGTPTVVSATTSYTITATNAAGTGTATISITVNNTLPVLAYAGSPFTYTKGTAITAVTPTNTGGVVTSCSSSPTLPAGLALSATCGITGTPTAVTATNLYTISAVNSGGTNTVSITITVNDVVPTLTFAGSPYTWTKGTAITAITPTNTGGVVTSCSISPSLPAGITLSATCGITGTPTLVTATASYTLTVTNSGGTSNPSITITVKDVAPTLAYAGSPFTYTNGTAITTLTPTNTGGAITSCASSPTLPTGLALSSGCVVSGTPSAVAAAANYTITATNSGGTANATINITVKDVAPVITYSPATYTLTQNVAISTITPTNTGGAITGCTSAPALPTGLSLSATTCAITGTPTAISGSTAYTITATNTGGSSAPSVTFTVNAAAPSIVASSSTNVEVIRNAITTISFTNSGGTITGCTSSPTLPTGLSISATTCAITGTPTVTSAATNYTITATNTGGSSASTISIQVKNQRQIAFYSKTATSGAMNGTAAGSNNIWTASQDGVTLTAVTQNTSASLDSIYPAFNSTGANLTFTSLEALTGLANGTSALSYNIWKSTSTGSSPTHLTGNSVAGLDGNSPPVYSPDGTKIVFASKTAISGSFNGTASGSYNIWIINSDGSGITPLTANTNSGLDSIQPVWDPGGSIIYFASKTATNGTFNGTASLSYNIWKVNTSGTGLTALTSNTAAGLDSWQPAVSPDATTVAFSSLAKISGTTPSSYNIWTVGTNGIGLNYLTSSTAAALDSVTPAWASDSTEIAFASKMKVAGATANSYNIWSMSNTGASQVALTTNTAAGLDSTTPAYSPDIVKIAFTSLMKIGATTANSRNIWTMNVNGTAQASVTSNTNAGLDSYLGSPGGVWYDP